MSNQDPTTTPLQRRLERRRARRRRQAVWAVPLLALAIVAAVVIVNRSDSDSPRATRTQSSAVTSPVDPTDRSTSSRLEGSTTTPTSSTGQSSNTSAGSPATVPVALPEADLTRPVDPPVGYYRQGKLYLEGSVPSNEAAAGYLRKGQSVLGAGNVVMLMELDPRAPVGPARVIVQEEFQFPTGSSAMDPKFNGLLAVGAYALKKVPESTLVITGYTDDVGPAEVNRALSQERAQLVVDFMVVNGIPANRIMAVGKGEADPIGDNTTPEGRRKNRRIEGTLEGVMPDGV